MADPSAQNDTRVGGPSARGSAPAAAPLPPGAPPKIGRFEVRALLGEGAFGRVYRGFDAELRRDVAIKVPHTAGLTAEFRERFLREARSIAAIHHPNVCPVYEVGTDGELPYIIMRFVAGTTLASVIDNLKTPMPPRNAVMILRKLALGMAAAHAQGVTHRDLKPANVLYDTANREVLITDFGLARIGGEANLTAKDSFLGTPAYTSPEQANRQTEKVGPLSDVYSLGVILYEMLTGDVPFTGSVMEVAIAHCITAPKPPSQVRPGIDAKLDAIVLKAMAKSPFERFKSAREFSDVLTEYLRPSEPSAGGPVGSAAELPAVALSGGREPDPEPAAETVAEKRPGRRTAPAFEMVPTPPPAPVVELDDEDEVTKETRKSGARKSAKKSGAKPSSTKSKAGGKKGRRSEDEDEDGGEEQSPVAVLMKNKVAVAGAVLGLLAVVLVVVLLARDKSEPQAVQKPKPTEQTGGTVTPPVVNPKADNKGDNKANTKGEPVVEPKGDVALRNRLVGRWRVNTGLVDAATLQGWKPEDKYLYLHFKTNGTVEVGVDSLDVEIRARIVRDGPQPVAMRFDTPGSGRIEFSQVPSVPKKNGFTLEPFTRGEPVTTRIVDDDLTLRIGTTTVHLTRVVLAP